MSVAALALPATVVKYAYIALTDTYPFSGAPTTMTFTFPRLMVADPLTSVGPPGAEPNNKAGWWPFFQRRHETSSLYWVQGHMLNHNVHGPGTPENLVPISNTLNTNMSAMVEELVKKLVSAGRVLRYVVEAHWDGAGGIFPDPTKHPEAMRRICGIRGLDADGTLLWGEQFAPTRLSWEVYQYTDFMNGVVQPIALSRYGHDATQWNNHFPHK